MDKRITYVLLAFFILLLGVATQPFWWDYLIKAKIVSSNQQSSLELPEEFTKITFTQPEGESVTLYQENNSWLVEGYQVDTQQINELLDDLNSLTVDSIVSSNPEKFNTYGASDSSPVVKLENASGESKELIVGYDAPQIGSLYVRPVGINEVYLVKSNLDTYVHKDVNQWRDKTLVSLTEEEIQSILLRRSGSVVTVSQNEEQQWVATLNGQERIIGEVAKARLFDTLESFAGGRVADETEVAYFERNINPVTVEITPQNGEVVTLTFIEYEPNSVWLATSSLVEDIFAVTEASVTTFSDSTFTLFQ